jgi:hypothetical protein
MKAVSIWFFALCFVTTSAIGQLYVGPLAGGQLSWTRFDNSDYYESYTVEPVWGYHAGASMSLKVRNRFFLHAALIYSTKGRKISGVQDPLLRNMARYRYVEAPILYAVDFRARMRGGREFKYYLAAGPNVSYWLGGKGTLYNSDLNENTEFSSQDLAYSISFQKEPDSGRADQMTVAEPNRVQLGLNLASGLVFEPQANQRIVVMIRYELGHSFLSRGNGTFVPTYYEDILQSRNKGISLSASYMIDLRIADRKRGKSNSTIRRRH